jgi:uncharacterized protein YfaS (alpha-2-macroglobulin family)
MTNNKQQTEINAVEYIDKVNQFAKENNTGKPKQQTAVEWLSDNIWDLEEQITNKEIVQLVEQAKAMHKEEIIQAWKKGDGQFDKVSDKMSLDYYEQTYGGGEQ